MQELEQLLVRLGFNPGLVDGVADTRTSAAIESYQEFAALRVDGVASPALLEELRGVAESLGVAVKSPPEEATPPNDGAAVEEAGVESSESSEPEAPPPTGQVTGQAAGQIAGQVAGAPWETAVHLASFKQEAKAHTEWQRLQQRLPNLFGDMESRVGAFDLGEEGLFFRLYAGPLPNLATAQDFCITVSLEGFRCGVARGVAQQIAATSPATPEPTSEPEPPEAQPEDEAEPAAETGPAEAETAAAAVETEAPETPSSLVESTDDESPKAEQPPEEQGEVALVPDPDVGVEPSSPDPGLAEPSDESESVTAAPTALVTAEQIAVTTSQSEPEAGSGAAANPATEDVTEDLAEELPDDTTEDPAVALEEAGQSGTSQSGPTLLIPTAQFAAASPDSEPGDRAERGPDESVVGSPTLLATMFDFGDEEEAPSAPPEPESGSTPSVAASAVGEPATSEAPEPETGETGAADAGSAVGEAAATAPAEAPEPEGTQTAAVPETGVEDYMEATAAFQIGDCTTALRHYEQAFDKGGLSRDALASAHNNRGRCLYSVGQFDEALADFDRAIGLDQDFAAAYYNRGRVHTAMGRSAEARADLKSAYDLGFGRLQAQE